MIEKSMKQYMEENSRSSIYSSEARAVWVRQFLPVQRRCGLLPSKARRLTGIHQSGAFALQHAGQDVFGKPTP